MRFTIASGTSPLEGFTIKRGVGIGGFGEVYFAVSDSGKEVALKRIARNLDVELRGVRQCLNLKHANLIGLWDIRKDHLGESWVVMEFVSGPSLRDEIMANDSGLPMDDVIWWFQGICAGVHYLHQNGIVHRDLKPGNIFQDNEAQLVKIGDYGLSKFISGSKRSGHTESVGTVHYMAPEIGRGIYGREIDIYSLGVILFELITGKVPFDGESTQEIIMKHMTAKPDVSVLPMGFRSVIEKCLVKDPEQRYDSVLSMVRDLPKEFMPPSLRRSASYLEDTDHYGKSTQENDTDGGAPDVENRSPQQDENISAEVLPEPANSPSQPPITFSNHSVNNNNSAPRPTSQVAGGASLSPSSPGVSRNSQQGVPPHPRTASPVGRQSRFNQPPGSSSWNNANHNSPPASPPPIQTAPDVSFQGKLDSVGQAVVFGEVVHHSNHTPHQPFSQANQAPAPSQPSVVRPGNGQPPTGQQIVTAQIVHTPAPPLPGKGSAPSESGSARSKTKYTVAQRTAMIKSSGFIRAAGRYMQMTPGVNQLSRLITGWLLSAALVGMGLLFLSFIDGPINAYHSTVAIENNSDSNIFITNYAERDSAFLWFALVAFAGNISILSVTRLWGPGPGFTWMRLATKVLTVLAISVFAYGAMIAMDSPVSALGYPSLIFQGAMGDVLFHQSHPFNGQLEWMPTLFGFFVYFSGLILLFPWWKAYSPIRERRIDWLLVFYSVLLGCLLSVFLNIYIIYSGLFGLLLGLSTQWGSFWFDDTQRQKIQSIAQSSS